MNKNKNKNILITIGVITIAVLLLLPIRCACSSLHDKTDEEADTTAVIDTATVISAIRGVSKLYTAEVDAHKTMHYESDNKLRFTLFGNTKSVHLPLAKTTADIPVTITYKAGIDLSTISPFDITVDSDTAIYITLPDPVVEQTAVSIDHEKEKIKSQLLAKGLDDKTYQQLVTQAKNDAWHEMSEADHSQLAEVAKVSATDILVPILRELGFKKIEIRYRDNYHIIVRERR